MGHALVFDLRISATLLGQQRTEKNYSQQRLNGRFYMSDNIQQLIIMNFALKKLPLIHAQAACM